MKSLPKSLIIELIELSYSVIPIQKQHYFYIKPAKCKSLNIYHTIPKIDYSRAITVNDPDTIKDTYIIVLFHYKNVIYVLSQDETRN